MRFDTFLTNFSDNIIINSSSFAMFDEKLTDIRRQVSGWLKKGYLIQLKKGVYVFSDTYRKITPSPRFIANYLVLPSYLSLEYALGYYDLIPEKVTVYSSVTTKKTQKFSNAFGKFEYCSIKKSLFFGFDRIPFDNQDFFIAFPEKAILDFFYFHEDTQGKPGEFEAFRFQNCEILNLKRFQEFSRKYPHRVKKAAALFIDFIKQEVTAYKRV